MSIIHEALKKAQNNLKEASPEAVHHPTEQTAVAAQPKVQPQPSAPRPSSTAGTRPMAPSYAKQPQATQAAQPVAAPTPAASTPQSFWNILPVNKLMFAAVLLVLLLAARPILTSAPSQNKTPAPAVIAPTVTPTAAPVTASTPAATTPVAAQGGIPAPVFRPQLILNGISMAGEKPLALINNEIYEVGQDVYGLTLLSISESGVELLDGDQKIFLRKRR